MRKGAEFSECRKYRYALWREWDLGKMYCTFIGLNPSTADETRDDPTIRRCIDFAQSWGYGGVRMLNLFSFRATDPRTMKCAVDPVGPDNDQALLRYLSDPINRLTVAAWGNHGAFRSRSWEVRKKLLSGFPMKCFRRTKKNEPEHPLYQPADAVLVDF